MPLDVRGTLRAGGTVLVALSIELARQLPDSDVARAMEDEVAETLHASEPTDPPTDPLTGGSRDA